MILETILGPIEASRLVLIESKRDLPCGKLTTKSYTLDGVVVKVDQHIDIETELSGHGSAQL